MIDFTKKAEIFKAVINYQQYFTIADELPENDGAIYDFYVIEIEAHEKFSIFQFEKTVIKAFTQKPVKQSREERARQFHSLIREYFSQTRKPVILIFQNAHLMNLKIFQAMKTVFEVAKRNETPLGIIFVGDISKIDSIIGADEGISLRADHIHLQDVILRRTLQPSQPPKRGRDVEKIDCGGKTETEQISEQNELHIPTLRRLAKKQLLETGELDSKFLDIIIEDWDLDLAAWKDPGEGRDLWRNLIELYLIAPKEFHKTVGYIKGIRDSAITLVKQNAIPESTPGNGIPDIVA